MQLFNSVHHRNSDFHNKTHVLRTADTNGDGAIDSDEFELYRLKQHEVVYGAHYHTTHPTLLSIGEDDIKALLEKEAREKREGL